MFSITTWESNAIIDVTFGYGYREIAGTVGRDAITYMPFTGRYGLMPPLPAERVEAVIGSGRFPTNASRFGCSQRVPSAFPSEVAGGFQAEAQRTSQTTMTGIRLRSALR